MKLVHAVGATLVLALAACAGPLAAPPPSQTTQTTQTTQSTLPVAGQARQVLPAAPTEAVARPTAAMTPTAAFADPIPTPLAAAATPVVPPLPTLTLPARPALDAPSRAALDAMQATAAAQGARATATALALPAQEIAIEGLAFAPPQLTVPPGTTIVWRNLDRVQHQVRGGEFDSGRIQSGGSWASVLGKPGVYQFLCAFHPTMRAEVTVTADDTRPLHLGT